jgi:hypothetical protein
LSGLDEKALIRNSGRRLVCRTSDSRHHGSGYSNWRA